VTDILVQRHIHAYYAHMQFYDKICFSFTHVHQRFMQHFYDIFSECRFCPCFNLFQWVHTDCRVRI